MHSHLSITSYCLRLCNVWRSADVEWKYILCCNRKPVLRNYHTDGYHMMLVFMSHFFIYTVMGLSQTVNIIWNEPIKPCFIKTCIVLMLYCMFKLVRYVFNNRTDFSQFYLVRKFRSNYMWTHACRVNFVVGKTTQ